MPEDMHINIHRKRSVDPDDNGWKRNEIFHATGAVSDDTLCKGDCSTFDRLETFC